VRGAASQAGCARCSSAAVGSKTLVDSLTADGDRDSFGLTTDADLAILKSESWFQVLVDQEQLSPK
jgi:hypothetical protein